MTAEEEVDLPEGYRLISDMTPGERARIDQSVKAARDTFATLYGLMKTHQEEDHDAEPCELPCGSLEVYAALDLLDLSLAKMVIYAVIHDAVATGRKGAR